MKKAQEGSQKVEKKSMAYASKNSRRGQMLVVVMMMITTVIIMFGMTVSVGHLVQSKINLQNSVDLASLSAASYQARHMNAMSVANYRIRAVLKFFLLDSYTTQGRFNSRFESDVMSGSGTISDPVGSFSVCQQARNYSPVGAIGEGGRGVDAQTNVCKNFLGDGQSKIITPIIASPFPGFNPIYIFINITLLQIAAEFQKSCTEWQGQNKVWADWAINRAASDTDQQAEQMSKVVNEFVRDMASGGPAQMLGSPGRAAQTAVATFQSNLIGSIMVSGRDLNSLLYLNDAKDRYLDLGDLQKSEKAFGLSYVDAKWAGGCEIVNNAGGANATAKSMVQGYSKRGGGGAGGGGKTISVGIVANADNPKILFWPEGIEPAMVAIAAAKPFGSRIGPPARYFGLEGGNGWGNVATFPGDTAGQLQEGGFGHKEILRYGLGQMPAPASGVPSSRAKDQFAEAAYAPTIFDSMYFSIFDPASPFAPTDVIPNLTISSPLRDRGGTLPDPYSWSMPPLSKHYKPAAMNSAWSPDPDGEPRAGYQIKMISIDDLCNISTSATLQRICQKEGTRLL